MTTNNVTNITVYNSDMLQTARLVYEEWAISHDIGHYGLHGKRMVCIALEMEHGFSHREALIYSNAAGNINLFI